MSERPRKSDFIKALKDIVEEHSARGEALEPDAMLDAAADRLGATLVRWTFVPERVPAPFPAPDGFDDHSFRPGQQPLDGRRR